MLTTITKKVLSYIEIPEEIKKPEWLENASLDTFVECHIDDEPSEELTIWILENYPELKDEDSFFIKIDY